MLLLKPDYIKLSPGEENNHSKSANNEPFVNLAQMEFFMSSSWIGATVNSKAKRSAGFRDSSTSELTYCNRSSLTQQILPYSEELNPNLRMFSMMDSETRSLVIAVIQMCYAQITDFGLVNYVPAAEKATEICLFFW